MQPLGTSLAKTFTDFQSLHGAEMKPSFYVKVSFVARQFQTFTLSQIKGKKRILQILHFHATTLSLSVLADRIQQWFPNFLGEAQIITISKLKHKITFSKKSKEKN